MTLPDTRAEQRPLAMSTSANGDVNPGAQFKSINDVEQVAKAVLLDAADIVTTSKGLELRINAMPNMIMAEARRKIKPPRVPTFFNTEKQTHEENPNDPAYQDAMQDYNIQLGTMGATAMLAFGTTIKHRPDDVEPPESESWAGDLKEIFDIEVPAAGKGRYAAWLRLYALTDPDLTKVLDAVSTASGVVKEAAVEEAEDTFRPDAEGAAATGLSAVPEG